jgi:hypothetical protein
MVWIALLLGLENNIFQYVFLKVWLVSSCDDCGWTTVGHTGGAGAAAAARRPAGGEPRLPVAAV